jgi:bifunctional pyridoxal-dependent enzyme with beta-cystathionase and maltose regulon repressor activities
MSLAERLERLGTETAFAVSLAAAEWGAKGNRIFPFHLGDLNIATSQNIVDAMNKATAQLLGYRNFERHLLKMLARVVDCSLLQAMLWCSQVANQ